MTKTPALRTALMGASALTASVFVMAAAGQVAAQDVVIAGGAGSTETRNTGASQTLSGRYIIVGLLGAGTLNVTDGGVVTSTLNTVLGDENGATGTLTVQGAGSSVTATDWLGIGHFGRGYMTVSDGGAAAAGDVSLGENAGSLGVLEVTGIGSSLTSQRFLDVGFRGSGQLSVTNGATAGSLTDVRIGVMAGATGVVTVAGAGSSLSAAGQLRVGDRGAGELTVSGGGTVGAQSGISIGSYASGQGVVTVTGPGSSLTSANWLYVGDEGHGELTVSNGGDVSAQGVIRLGVNASGQGLVTVTGSGSSLTGSAIYVGSGGSGELTVSNGASVSAANDFVIGDLAGSTGAAMVTGAGSRLEAANQLIVGRNGQGSLVIAEGAQVAAHRLMLGEAGAGVGAVTVTGAGSRIHLAEWLQAGWEGQGDLLVTAGGTITAQGANFGGSGVGNGAISGAGSRLDVTDWLHVGWDGRGNLQVAAGGAVTAGLGAVIGNRVGSVGEATVTGAGSTLRSEHSIYVGDSAVGTLSIADGGQVSARWSVILAQYASGEGAVTVTGAGSALIANNIIVGLAGRGELTVANGGEVGFMDLAVDAGSFGLVSVGGRSGAAAQGAGTLNGVRFGAGDGLLVFNHNTDGYIFTGGIGGTTAGQGRIRFEAGRTRFNTTDFGFTGVSDIYSGAALHLNGALMGTLNVLAGGELSGVGAIGDLNVDGVVRMGGDSTIGTLTGTSANFNAGSLFVVDIAGRMADTLVLSGAANIASGSLLRVVVNPGAVYTAGDRSVILSAAGGLTGRFTLEGGPRALTNFLSLRDGYSATQAYLEVALVRDFATAGVTANQRAAGAGAQSLGAGALFNAIANMPNDAAAQVAFDALSGELHPGVRGVISRDGDRLQRVVIRNSLAGEREAGARVWGEAWTSNGRTDGDGNAERLDHDSVGFLAGADTHVGGGWRLGAALGYDQGDVSSDRGSGTADLKRRSILAYADGRLAGWDLRGGLGYTDVSVDTRRLVAFASPAGNFREALAAEYDGSVTHAFVDAGYPFAVGDAQVAPFVNLSRVSVDTDAFSERTGLAALNVNQASADLTFSTLGLRAGGVAFAGAELSGSAGWRHASGDRDAVGVHAFAGGSGFEVRTVQTARSAAVIDLDAQWTPSSNLKLGAGVSYVGGSDQSDFGARLSLRYSF